MIKQGFLGSSVVLLISAAMVKVIGALFKIPLTNMLGGTAMGYFSCAYGLLLPLYALTSTGLCAAAAKITAGYSENAADTAKIRSVTMRVFVAGGLIGSVLLAVFARFFAERVFSSAEAFPAVLMISPCVVFGCVTSVCRGCCEGKGNVSPTAVSQLVEAAVKLSAGLLLATAAIRYYDEIKFLFPDNTSPEAAGAAGAVLGVTVSCGFGALCFAFIKKERSPAREISSLDDAFILRSVFATMIPVSLGALVTNLSSFIDLVTMNRILTETVAENTKFFNEKLGVCLPTSELPDFIFGSFSGLAVTIFTLVPSITNMLGKVALPAASNAHSHGDTALLRSTVEFSVALTSLLAFPCAFGIAAIPREILNLLYSSRPSEIAASYQSLGILGMGVIFLCLSFPVFSIFQGVGRADLPLKIMLAGVAVKLAGNIALLKIPQTALFGAAISTVVSYSVIFFVSAAALKKICGVALGFRKNIFPYIVPSAACGAAAYLSNSFFAEIVGDKIACLLAVAVAAAVYVAGVAVLGGFKAVLLHRGK